MLLVYGPNQPDGNLDDRLELCLPLTPQGWMDPAGYAAAPHGWPGRRVFPDGQEIGCELTVAGSGWALQRPEGDDPVWDIEARVFRPGEYVTLRDPEAAEFIFRIVSVAKE